MSETSFKFFIQFVVYTAIYCGYLLIVNAYYTAEIRRNVSITYSLRQQQGQLTFLKTGGANPHWAVCIGL